MPNIVQNNQVPPFTLYGLHGCTDCAQAETFLRSRGLPFMLVICNDDPIAQAGAAIVTKKWMEENGKDRPQFPILISRVTREWFVSFNKREYERMANACYDVASAGTASIFGSGQQPIEEASVAHQPEAIVPEATVSVS